MIMEKMKSCLWKLQLGFWSYGLIRLLSPSGTNVVSWPQTPRLNFFLRFHDFIGFISWFLIKWDPVCQNCSRVLDLWLDMFSGPKWPKCSFWLLNPKVKTFFEISWFYWIQLMILEKMRPCLWKLQLGFWTYGLISPLPKYLGPNFPKLVFRP